MIKSHKQINLCVALYQESDSGLKLSPGGSLLDFRSLVFGGISNNNNNNKPQILQSCVRTCSEYSLLSSPSLLLLHRVSLCLFLFFLSLLGVTRIATVSFCEKLFHTKVVAKNVSHRVSNAVPVRDESVIPPLVLTDLLFSPTRRHLSAFELSVERDPETELEHALMFAEFSQERMEVKIET